MRILFASLAVISFSAPALAAWNVAQSKHFVIYADDNPKHLAEFATQLERFDQAARLATQMDDPEIGKGNRLTVFVVPTEKVVRSIIGDKAGFFAVVHTGRVSSSLAYVPKRMYNDSPNQKSRFFHE